VPGGWAPYHYGHWVNHAPWGWVWIEDESWGYAPFHYGRWVAYNGRWGWVPGPPAAHPVWSPALVVFAGGIHVGGVGVSAWFPLGPGEPYRPWYHTSPQYMDDVNRSNMGESQRVHVQTTYVNVNVVNITYVNRTTVTAMRQEDFASGRPAHQSNVVVDVRQMDRVQPLAAPEPKPTAQSFVGHAPARAVKVSVARPVLINDKGKAVSTKPGSVAVEPPVKPAPPVRVVPGHTAVAPPAGAARPQPGAKLPTAPVVPVAPARPDAKALPEPPGKPAVEAPGKAAPQLPTRPAPPAPQPSTQPSAKPAVEAPGKPSPQLPTRPAPPAAQPAARPAPVPPVKPDTAAKPGTAAKPVQPPPAKNGKDKKDDKKPQ